MAKAVAWTAAVVCSLLVVVCVGLPVYLALAEGSLWYLALLVAAPIAMTLSMIVANGCNQLLREAGVRV